VQGDCLSGNYYLQLNGTDPAREGFGRASVQPVVLPDEPYKFTGYVKGRSRFYPGTVVGLV